MPKLPQGRKVSRAGCYIKRREGAMSDQLVLLSDTEDPHSRSPPHHLAWNNSEREIFKTELYRQVYSGLPPSFQQTMGRKRVGERVGFTVPPRLSLCLAQRRLCYRKTNKPALSRFREIKGGGEKPVLLTELILVFQLTCGLVICQVSMKSPWQSLEGRMQNYLQLEYKQKLAQPETKHTPKGGQGISFQQNVLYCSKNAFWKDFM